MIHRRTTQFPALRLPWLPRPQRGRGRRGFSGWNRPRLDGQAPLAEEPRFTSRRALACALSLREPVPWSSWHFPAADSMRLHRAPSGSRPRFQGSARGVRCDCFRLGILPVREPATPLGNLRPQIARLDYLLSAAKQGVDVKEFGAGVKSKKTLFFCPSGHLRNPDAPGGRGMKAFPTCTGVLVRPCRIGQINDVAASFILGRERGERGRWGRKAPIGVHRCPSVSIGG
jgi:hypothetical protein